MLSQIHWLEYTGTPKVQCFDELIISLLHSQQWSTHKPVNITHLVCWKKPQLCTPSVNCLSVKKKPTAASNKNYIFDGGRMIAIDTWHSNPAKPDQLDYVHRDHIDAITDSNGSIVARRNFAPFGQCVKQRGGWSITYFPKRDHSPRLCWTRTTSRPRHHSYERPGQRSTTKKCYRYVLSHLMQCQTEIIGYCSRLWVGDYCCAG